MSSQEKWLPLSDDGRKKKKTLVQSEKSSENTLAQTIRKYPGCAFYHMSPSLASSKAEKSSLLDCLVLLGTSDFMLANLLVIALRNCSCSLYKTIFTGSKYPKMVLFDFENKITAAYIKADMWNGSSLNCRCSKPIIDKSITVMLCGVSNILLCHVVNPISTMFLLGCSGHSLYAV